VLLAAVACAEPVSDAAAQADPVPEPEPIVPLEGEWTVDSRTVLSDECGGILGDDQPADAPDEDKDSFALTLADEDVFTIAITFDDGERYDVDCAFDADGLFTCVGEHDVYTVSDTTLRVSWSGGGELFSDTQLTATLDAIGSCDGSLCEVAEAYLEAELPCGGSMTMEASTPTPVSPACERCS